jgi:hypothetical protein
MRYLILLLAILSTQVYSEPLFPDEDTESDQCEAACDEDSLGRIIDKDGDKWKQGADGAWRDDKGNTCRWSKSLEVWVCK